MDFINWILTPFRWLMSGLLWLFHEVFSFLGLNPDSGWTWALSIIFVTVGVRAALIPLFARQIRSQRAMQALQPELRKLQAKYKGKKDQVSQQAMLAEQRALFKKHNTGMFSSCLPLLVQMPFFFSLYRVLSSTSQAVNNKEGILVLSADKVKSFDDSTIFGARLSDTFINTLRADQTNVAVIVVAIIMIIAMVASQFFTQRQLMTKNMTQEALEGPFMRQQKMMMYVLPLVFGVGGINFPIGLLIYWTASNVWTLCQQMWVIKYNPTPGSLAEKELNIRRAAKGLPPIRHSKAEIEAEEEPKAVAPRQQPQRKNRRKK